MQRNRILPVLWVLAASIALNACGTPPARPLSTTAPSFAVLPNGNDPLNPTQPSKMFMDVVSKPGDNLVRVLERRHGRPLNLLSLS